MLEGEEAFDSNLLKQMIESMIASGKRNITVDLSPLDYLYSDAINALIAMNKRMLDVMGRLSLLSPQPSVLDILKKSGLQNILKIFATEADVIRTSEELTGQAPAPVRSAPPPPPQEPQSEFDDLRSEIGSAFEPKMPLQQRAPAPQEESAPFGDASFPPSQPQQRGPFAAPPQPQFTPQPPVGPAPRYAPPPPPLRPFEQTAQRPPAHPFTPAPPAPPKPAAFGATGAETRRMPVIPTEASIPVRPFGQSEDELDKFEATLESKAPVAEKPKASRFADELDEAPKKRSLMPVMVILLVIVVLGGGGYYAYVNFIQNKTQESGVALPSPVVPEKKEAPVPQLPTTTQEPAAAAAQPSTSPAPAAQPAVAAAPSAPAAPAVAAAKPAPAPVVQKSTKKKVEAVAKAKLAAKAHTPKATPAAAAEDYPPISSPVEATPAPSSSVVDLTEPAEPAPKAVASAPAPAPAPKVSLPPPEPAAPALEPAPSSSGAETASIFLSSIPPVADVYMDGKLIGKTNIVPINLLSGTHTMRFVKGDKELTKQMTFQPGKNASQFIMLK